MTRIFGLNVIPEMLGLWLLETSICFFVFYILLHGSPLLPLPVGLLASPAHPAVADALLLALTVGVVGFSIGLYRPEACVETRRLLLKAAVAAAVSLPAVWLVAKIGKIDMAGLFGSQPGWPLEMLLAWGLLLLVTRLLYIAALRMNLFVRRVAVLGPPAAAAGTVEAISSMRRFLFCVEAVQPPGAGVPPISTAASGAASGSARLPDRLWGVVFAGPAAVTPQAAGRWPGVRHFDAETFWEDQLGRIDIAAAARRDNPGAAFAQSAAIAGPAVGLAILARRLLDIVLATSLLLLTAPVLLVTALLIPLESPGPVFYRQERVGLDGRHFTLWKFRSMRRDAERLGPTWASLQDSRVTAVGGVIRKVRIDELPQLLNILRGEMSMVGPRPERPHFVEQLADVIPLYRERVRVKPGLTGWAQINYPYGASVEDARAKASYDLYYVKHRSLLFDLLILLATVRVILFQEGAR